MPTLSIVMPFYRNSGILALHYQFWSMWPEELKQRVEIVIVDDGSPEPAVAVERPDGLPALSIFRVLVDKPWNQHGARNIGAKEASGDWLLLTDMDHVIEQDQIERLLRMIDAFSIAPDEICTLARIDADTRQPTLSTSGNLKPHPNSFVLLKALYWRIGGYDEEFVGQYGTDGLFRKRAFRVGRHRHLDDVVLTRYSRDVVPDASTTTLPRKEGRVPGAREAILAAKRSRGEENVVKLFQAPWERSL